MGLFVLTASICKSTRDIRLSLFMEVMVSVIVVMPTCLTPPIFATNILLINLRISIRNSFKCIKWSLALYCHLELLYTKEKST